MGYRFETHPDSYWLEKVKQDGCSLQYVKDQTESICLAAIEQNGYSLQYVELKSKKLLDALDSLHPDLSAIVDSYRRACA